ncbi:MAG: DALR domain-containing protein, partial [Bacteroidales bacterium]
FDIHGGGMDLLFPHHESEIAQSNAAYGHDPCKYWMHNNMITINGQKMGKSLGNFITLEALFTGTHPALDKAYSPMTVRFFILQAQYRGTLDFSNEALMAAEKGFKRLMQAKKMLTMIPVSQVSSVNIAAIQQKCLEAMNDDLNTPMVIAQLFEVVRLINSALDKKESFTNEDILAIEALYATFVEDIMGLTDEQAGQSSELINGLMQMVLDMRQDAKIKKDFANSDNIQVKDGKEGVTWQIV